MALMDSSHCGHKASLVKLTGPTNKTRRYGHGKGTSRRGRVDWMVERKGWE